MRPAVGRLPLLSTLLAAPAASRAHDTGGDPISLGLFTPLQIGLVNIAQKGGMLPVFPIFNFSFK